MGLDRNAPDREVPARDAGRDVTRSAHRRRDADIEPAAEPQDEQRGQDEGGEGAQPHGAPHRPGGGVGDGRGFAEEHPVVRLVRREAAPRRGHRHHELRTAGGWQDGPRRSVGIVERAVLRDVAQLRLGRAVQEVPAPVHELQVGAVAELDPGQQPPDAVELVDALEHADRTGAFPRAEGHRVPHRDRPGCRIDRRIALRGAVPDRALPQRIRAVPHPLGRAGGDHDEPVAFGDGEIDEFRSLGVVPEVAGEIRVDAAPGLDRRADQVRIRSELVGLDVSLADVVRDERAGARRHLGPALVRETLEGPGGPPTRQQPQHEHGDQRDPARPKRESL